MMRMKHGVCGSGTPGAIGEETVGIACNSGICCVRKAHAQGSKPMLAADHELGPDWDEIPRYTPQVKAHVLKKTQVRYFKARL